MSIGNFLRCLNGFTLLPGDDGQPYHVTQGDPGGATSFGVTIATYSQYLGYPATTEEMQALTPEAVAPVYQSLFWNKIVGDRLPLGVDLMVFDHGVLAGPGASAMTLQQTLRVSVDGYVGAQTETAAQMATMTLTASTVLIGKIAWNQELAYRSDGGFSEFGKGWLARLDARVTAALAMLNGS